MECDEIKFVVSVWVEHDERSNGEKVDEAYDELSKRGYDLDTLNKMRVFINDEIEYEVEPVKRYVVWKDEDFLKEFGSVNQAIKFAMDNDADAVEEIEVEGNMMVEGNGYVWTKEEI